MGARKCGLILAVAITVVGSVAAMQTQVQLPPEGASRSRPAAPPPITPLLVPPADRTAGGRVKPYNPNKRIADYFDAGDSHVVIERDYLSPDYFIPRGYTEVAWRTIISDAAAVVRVASSKGNSTADDRWLESQVLATVEQVLKPFSQGNPIEGSSLSFYASGGVAHAGTRSVEARFKGVSPLQIGHLYLVFITRRSSDQANVITLDRTFEIHDEIIRPVVPQKMNALWSQREALLFEITQHAMVNKPKIRK
jgi:hypothetical protein